MAGNQSFQVVFLGSFLPGNASAETIMNEYSWHATQAELYTHCGDVPKKLFRKTFGNGFMAPNLGTPITIQATLNGSVFVFRSEAHRLKSGHIKVVVELLQPQANTNAPHASATMKSAQALTAAKNPQAAKPSTAQVPPLPPQLPSPVLSSSMVPPSSIALPPRAPAAGAHGRDGTFNKRRQLIKAEPTPSLSYPHPPVPSSASAISSAASSSSLHPSPSLSSGSSRSSSSSRPSSSGTQIRAPAGGAIGSDGKVYKGGQFMK